MMKEIKGKSIVLSFLVFLLLTVPGYAGTIKGKVVSAKKVRVPENVLMYIEKVEGKEEFPLPKKPAKMDQIKMVFTPKVLPVLKGTAVEFHNSDDVVHNVFGVGDDEFDLGTWKGDEFRTYTFNKLGVIAILCNVHPEMEAYVVVLQNPYFALTDEEGKYEIKNVPPGEYKLKTWHDRLKSVTEKVEVPEKGEIVVNFELKR